MMDRRQKSLFSKREWDQIAEALSLSPRELEITYHVFHDLKEAAIARRLGISPHTVHTYLERIYRKLVVNSRVQMVVRVVGEYLCLRSASSRGAAISRPPGSHVRIGVCGTERRIEP